MFFKKQPSHLDVLIMQQFEDLDNTVSGSPEQAKIMAQIVKLYELKIAETKTRISPDTWATIGANLVGIGIIVGYEHAHVITSKAVQFLMKLKS